MPKRGSSALVAYKPLELLIAVPADPLIERAFEQFLHGHAFEGGDQFVGAVEVGLDLEIKVVQRRRLIVGHGLAPVSENANFGLPVILAFRQASGVGEGFQHLRAD